MLRRPASAAAPPVRRGRTAGLVEQRSYHACETRKRTGRRPLRSPRPDNPDHHRSRRRWPTSTASDDVLALLQFRHHRAAVRSSSSRLPGIHGVVVEAGHQVAVWNRGASTAFCGFIPHCVASAAPAAATVPACRRPAWRAQRNLVRPRRHRRAQRYAGTLAARQFVRVPGHQQKALRALGERDPGIAGDHRRQPRARRRDRNAMPSLSMASTQVVSLASSLSSILIAPSPNTRDVGRVCQTPPGRNSSEATF